MIKTKKPQVIEAQLSIESIVFLDAHSPQFMDKEQSPRVDYTVDMFLPDADGKPKEKPCRQLAVTYKRETWNKLFGNLTATEIDERKDEMLIQEIDFVNRYEFPEGATKLRYWKLTAEDLEVVK